MYDEIIACLDGSSRSETILPLAQGIAGTMRAKLRILRVLADWDDLPAEEPDIRERARLFGAEVKFIVAADPGTAILEQLRQSPRAIPAMTSHGRTACMEAVTGTVALRVLRGAGRPVILYHSHPPGVDAPHTIETIITALDGSAFSEKIIPFAIEFARSLTAKITLVQALARGSENLFSPLLQSDISESSYLRSRATEIKKQHGIEPNWDTLHGEAAQAICRFVHGMPNTMLALTSHARTGLAKVVLGSVAATCLRHAGVPLLLYWPADEC